MEAYFMDSLGYVPTDILKYVDDIHNEIRIDKECSNKFLKQSKRELKCKITDDRV